MNLPAWQYEGSDVLSHEDLADDCHVFVYILHYKDGRKYIGKKQVRAVRTKPPLAGKKRKRRILTNIPFVNYVGSHGIEDLPEITKREILYQCKWKNTAAYIEYALLMEHDTLFTDEYINSCIGGVYYDNVMDGLIE